MQGGGLTASSGQITLFDFGSGSSPGWGVGGSGAYSFVRNSGSTSSSSTGPSSGPSGASWYFYAETSSPRSNNDLFRLSYDGSACKSAGEVRSITFSYHMYGGSTGTLRLKSGVGTTLWTKSGNQGNSWLTAAVDIGHAAFYFDYNMGSSFTGDTAIGLVKVWCLVPPDLKSSSLEVRTRSTKATAVAAAVCAARDYGRSSEKTGQDDGTAFGPTSSSEASCKVSGGAAEAGFYSIEVKQSDENKGFATVGEEEAKIDLVSGKRYHFELLARISSISPLLAPVHGGIPITVYGSGFGTDPLAIDARLGSTPCIVTQAVVDGFTCDLADGEGQFSSVDDWVWPSERGVRWQWYYWSSLNATQETEHLRLAPHALSHPLFPEDADGEILLPMAQVVRRWSDNFVSRITGWFVAPSTVDYAFFIRADDTALFYLSENETSVRPEKPLVKIDTPLLQWTVEPQSASVSMRGGQRYWFELLCSRSSEYTGYGSPEANLAAATSGQDGYRMGRCDIGVRVHAPASQLPGGVMRGAAFDVQQLVLMTSAVGFTELGLEGCSQWVRLNQTLVLNFGPPPSEDVEQAVKLLLPAVPLIEVVREKLSDDAYLYNITIKTAGSQSLLRARSYGVEWYGVRAKVGGIDVLPITGDMLIAPSLKRRPTLSVRLGNQTTAACGSVDWGAQHVGCFLRFQPRYTVDYQIPDDVLVINATSISVGGMTLERCSMHCEKNNYSYFAVSPLSGITQECGCLREVDTDNIDKYEAVAKEKCSAECTSDAQQLCGGRSTSLGERYASVYKASEPDRSLHYEFSSATPEPQKPCRLDFWSPSYRVTGTFPKHAVAGDPVFVLVSGVNESVTPVDRLNEGLTICGYSCHMPEVERAALLANFSTGPWKEDIPMGVYDAVPLLCRMPECEAGRSQVLAFFFFPLSSPSPRNHSFSLPT